MNDGGTWRVEAGNLLICERSAEPLAEDGWLQPNNAAWVLRG